jgi:hypothetical protein
MALTRTDPSQGNLFAEAAKLELPVDSFDNPLGHCDLGDFFTGFVFVVRWRSVGTFGSSQSLHAPQATREGQFALQSPNKI